MKAEDLVAAVGNVDLLKLGELDSSGRMKLRDEVELLEKKAARLYRKSRLPEHQEALRNCILTRALLCCVAGNQSGWGYALQQARKISPNLVEEVQEA